MIAKSVSERALTSSLSLATVSSTELVVTFVTKVSSLAFAAKSLIEVAPMRRADQDLLSNEILNQAQNHGGVHGTVSNPLLAVILHPEKTASTTES
jgi:hypothetical protein